MKRSASAPSLAPATRLKASFSSVMDLASMAAIIAMATAAPIPIQDLPLTSIANVAECSRIYPAPSMEYEKALCLATPDDPSIFSEKDRDNEPSTIAAAAGSPNNNNRRRIKKTV